MTNAAYIAATSFDGTGAVVKIERFDDASPVIYISNNDSMTQKMRWCSDILMW